MSTLVNLLKLILLEKILPKTAEDTFKLNRNGLLNKAGENTIYQGYKEIVKFGVGEISGGVMYLKGGFLSLIPGHGYGKAAIKFLFSRLPKINNIRLKCKDGVLAFWTKAGGKVISKDDNYNTVDIYRPDVIREELKIWQSQNISLTL